MDAKAFVAKPARVVVTLYATEMNAYFGSLQLLRNGGALRSIWGHTRLNRTRYRRGSKLLRINCSLTLDWDIA
jgi:hypothetical protein